MDVDHKHSFKFREVEDFFLFQRLVFFCSHCFTMCLVDRREFYDILTDSEEVRWNEGWRLI